MRRSIPIALATAAAMALVPAAAPAAPPANDDFEAATATSGPLRGGLAEATRQQGEPNHGLHSVWYAYRAPASGRVAIVHDRNSEAVNVNVYTGETITGLQRTGVIDTDIPRVTFDAAAGTTYRIAVASSYEEGTQRFSMRVVPAPIPANDDFAASQTVKVPGRYQGSLTDATDELGEPRNAGGKPQRSLWYRFRPKRTGRLSVQASSRGCRPSVTVFIGSDLASLRRRAGATGRTLRFTARRGQTYRLAVDCGYRAIEPFELTISDGSVAGKGVSVEPVAGQTIDSVIERGLRTIVKAKRKTTVSVELTVSAATARDLGLERRVIGRVRGALGYRQKLPATIRLTSEARDALTGQVSLAAVLRVTLLGTDAPNRTMTVPVTLPN